MSTRQNLIVATLLMPLGATMVMALARVTLRHYHIPALVVVPDAPAAQVAALPETIAARAPAPRTWPGVILAPAPAESGFASAMNEARLRRDPGDIDARAGLVVSAIAAGQIDRADAMVRQGLQQSPSEPKAWIASAGLASARGNREHARHDLARARDLRMQQLGYSDNGDDDSTLPAVTLAPGGDAYRGRTVNAQRWTLPDAQFTQADPDLTVPPILGPPGRFGSPTSLAPPTIAKRGLDTRPIELMPPVEAASDDVPASVIPARFAPGQIAAGNPFRAEPGAKLGGTALASSGEAVVLDPLTQQIDREIAVLDQQMDPALQAGFGFRVRSGNSGFSKLTELTAPVEGEFSPGGYGRLKLSVTPTFLMAGKVGTGIAHQQLFGAGAFGQAIVGGHDARGTALNVAYAFEDLSGDVGSTPLGFPITNVVGGARWAPKLSDNLTLRVIGERRAITDSVLSFAGARDPATGTTWGGVTRTRGRVNLEASAGLASLYVGAGGGVLTGAHVQRNTEIEAGMGGSYPVLQTGTGELRVGLDLVYLSFAKNQGSFTLGQGGYFSPQQFFAAIVPVTYRDKVSDDLTYEVGGSVGVQNVRSKSSLYYPIDPILQSALVAQQSGADTTLAGVGTVHGASRDTGIAGSAHALIDYAVTPSLRVGAKASIEHVGNYTEGSGLVYARYIFNRGTQPR